MKYERSITYHSKAMANVKDFVNKETGQKQYAPQSVYAVKMKFTAELEMFLKSRKHCSKKE